MNCGTVTARLAWLALAALATAAFAAVAGAQSEPSGRLSVRAGIEHATGEYAGSATLDDLYLPLSVIYERRRLALRVTVPYLRVQFADVDPAGDTAIVSESGLGDAVAALTAFDVFRSADRSVALDLTGKIKLATGDEARGLGTGETDYSLQADLYKFLGRATLLGTVGYRLRGQPPGITLDNSWLAAAGTLYRITSRTRGGLFFDYRQSAIPGAPAISELTLSLSRVLDAHWRMQGYLVHGFSDTSLDYGFGLSLRRDF